MKRLFAIGLSVAVLGLGNAALAATTDNSVPSAEDIRQNYASSALATETIDDIAIPVGVLRSIQYEHQGYAVTEAKKIKRGGQDLYRLRIDKDDVSNDYESFYYMYDMSWNRVGEREIAPPPKPEPKPEENKPEPKPDKPEKPEKPEEQPEGGRGGGEDNGGEEREQREPREDSDGEETDSDSDENENAAERTRPQRP